jgi:hypothetical protein
MSTREYAYPEALVDTDWVAEHLHDPQVRIIESNEVGSPFRPIQGRGDNQGVPP